MDWFLQVFVWLLLFFLLLLVLLLAVVVVVVVLMFSFWWGAGSEQDVVEEPLTEPDPRGPACILSRLVLDHEGDFGKHSFSHYILTYICRQL